MTSVQPSCHFSTFKAAPEANSFHFRASVPGSILDQKYSNAGLLMGCSEIIFLTSAFSLGSFAPIHYLSHSGHIKTQRPAVLRTSP